MVMLINVFMVPVKIVRLLASVKRIPAAQHALNVVLVMLSTNGNLPSTAERVVRVSKPRFRISGRENPRQVCPSTHYVFNSSIKASIQGIKINLKADYMGELSQLSEFTRLAELTRFVMYCLPFQQFHYMASGLCRLAETLVVACRGTRLG